MRSEESAACTIKWSTGVEWLGWGSKDNFTIDVDITQSMATVFTAFEWLLGSTPTSGAIDVVAIKNVDGSIKCSPFHVKLAKGRKDVRLVRLKVNGKETDLKMKVGRAGEAFFVEHSEQHEYITRRLRSSPPLSPQPDRTPGEGIEIYRPVLSPVNSEPMTDPTTEAAVAKDEAAGDETQPEAPFAPKARKAKDLFTMSTLVGADSYYEEASTPPMGAQESGSVATAEQTYQRSKQSAWTWTWGDLPIKSSKNTSKVSFHRDLDKMAGSTAGEAPGSAAQTEVTSELPYIDRVETRSSGLDSEAAPQPSTELADPEPIDAVPLQKEESANQFVPCRMFSLCGHIISELVEESKSEVLSDPAQLFHILRSHSIAKHSFYDNPSKYLNDPRLVVLVRDTLLTWPVAKVMFETVVQAHQQLVTNTTAESSEPPAEIDDGNDVINFSCLVDRNSCSSSTGEADTLDSSASSHTNVSLHAQPCWAGRRITQWFADDEQTRAQSLLLSDDGGTGIVSEKLVGNAFGTAVSLNDHADLELGEGLEIDRPSLDLSNGSDKVSSSSAKCGEHIDHAAVPGLNRELKRKVIEDNWEAYLTNSSNSQDSTGVQPSESASSLVQFFHDNHIQEVSLDLLSSYHSFIVNKNGHSTSNLSAMGTRNSSFYFPNLKDSPGTHQFFLDHIQDPFFSNSFCGCDSSGAQWLHNNIAGSELWTWGHDESDRAEEMAEAMPSEAQDAPCDGDLEGDQSADSECALVQQSQEDDGPVENNLNLKQLSLLEISLEDICPGPARGEMYGYQCNDISDTDSYYSLSLDEGDEGAATDADNGPEDANSIESTEVARKIPRKYLYRKSLVPTQTQLESMGLMDGENEIIFEVDGCAPVTAQLFLWPDDARLVVADIEGMILHSSKPKQATAPKVSGAQSEGNSSGTGWGSLFFSFGSSVGQGSSSGEATTNATQLLHDIAKNGYHIVYIATESMTQSSSTKIELVKATEKSSTRLPPGPVFLSPDTLVRSFESQRPDLFKAAVLRGTRSLFPSTHNPFYSGFCTNVNDMNAFMRCGFPEGRIFLASESSEIKVMNWTTKWTYKDMHSFLHEMFPSYFDSQRGGGVMSKTSQVAVEDAYNDFNYWKIQMKTV